MKKIMLLGLAIGIALSFGSCSSKKNSSFKAAYDQAKQQELAQGQGQATDAIEISPVESTTQFTNQAAEQTIDNSYREERVVIAEGEQGALRAFSVVCGSFKSKTNAEALRSRLVTDGYAAFVVQNPSTGMYRVVCASYDDRNKAAEARAQFKASYPNDADFQKAWLLYNK